MARKKLLLIISAALVAVVALVAIYALRTATAKHESKQYAMTGVVLGVKPEPRKLIVANDGIANFMEPMVMEYDVKDATVLSSVKRGDEIRATLVSDGASQWVLQEITITPRR